jgi:transposase
VLKGVGSEKVYLAYGPTDLRKSMDGLAAIVQTRFHEDPYSSSLFVFCNRGRDRLKILRWDRNGFWLYVRRLDVGKFRWPDSDPGKALEVSAMELGWLLDGLPISQAGAHRKVSPKLSC